MAVCGQLLNIQRHLLDSASLGEDEAVALMDWQASAQIG
jgi:hypothetical protein